MSIIYIISKKNGAKLTKSFVSNKFTSGNRPKVSTIWQQKSRIRQMRLTEVV